MGMGYLLVLLFGGYVALKYYAITLTVEKKRKNQMVAPPGRPALSDLADCLTQ